MTSLAARNTSGSDIIRHSVNVAEAEEKRGIVLLICIEVAIEEVKALEANLDRKSVV